MAEDKEFIGLWIPIFVLHDCELTPQEKIVLADIIALSQNKHGCCTASNQYIGSALNLTTDRTRKIIYKLHSKGYIKTAMGYDQERDKTIRYMTPARVDKNGHPSLKCPPPMVDLGTDGGQKWTGGVPKMTTPLGEKGTPTVLKTPTNNIVNNKVNNIVDSKEDKKECSGYAHLVDYYQSNIHPIPNQVEADDLEDMFNEFGYEWMIQAIKEAARSRATSIRYIAGILRNWKASGLNEPWKKERKKKETIPQLEMAARAIAMLEAEEALKNEQHSQDS